MSGAGLPAIVGRIDDLIGDLNKALAIALGDGLSVRVFTRTVLPGQTGTGGIITTVHRMPLPEDTPALSQPEDPQPIEPSVEPVADVAAPDVGPLAVAYIPGAP